MNLAIMKKCAGRGDGTNSYYLPLNSWPSFVIAAISRHFIVSSRLFFILIFSHILDSFFCFSNSNYVFSDSFLPLFLQFEIKFENELGELPPPLIGPSPHNFSDFHPLTFSNSLATRR